MTTELAIMDAWWDADEFVAISVTMRRVRVNRRRLPRLADADPDQRRRFEIDPEGAFVYWPDLDLHLGWSQLQQIADPAALLRARQKSAAFNRRYGAAVRGLRRQHGLAQSAIAGLDARTVRRIEQGGVRATSNAVGKLAAAHGMAPNDYMAALAQRLERRSRARSA